MEKENITLTFKIEISQDTYKYVDKNTTIYEQMKRAAETKLYETITMILKSNVKV